MQCTVQSALQRQKFIVCMLEHQLYQRAITDRSTETCALDSKIQKFFQVKSQSQSQSLNQNSRLSLSIPGPKQHFKKA